MKKIKMFAAAAMFCAATFAGYTAYDKATMTDQERLFKANLEALTWMEDPETGDDRKPMAVQCGSGGWNIVSGCCYGYTSCTNNECDEDRVNGCESW